MTAGPSGQEELSPEKKVTKGQKDREDGLYYVREEKGGRTSRTASRAAGGSWFNWTRRTEVSSTIC